MIVWLASYPRSGNTLLRQVLRCCFKLPSYEGLKWNPDFDPTHELSRTYWGNQIPPDQAEAFYEEATRRPERVLIKTHDLPRDDQDAIYVVRDGRLALRSYLRFQDTCFPGMASFWSLLLGDDHYGGWSAHFRAWMTRPAGTTLLVRFEELVTPSPGLLQTLAAFLGYREPLAPWRNPQEDLQRLDPKFFGKGESVWSGDERWREPQLHAFFAMHGSLMRELGYATPQEVEQMAEDERAAVLDLLRYAHRLVQAKRDGERHLRDKEDVIADLARAAEARLVVINDLKRAADERLAIINQFMYSP